MTLGDTLNTIRRQSFKNESPIRRSKGTEHHSGKNLKKSLTMNLVRSVRTLMVSLTSTSSLKSSNPNQQL